MEMTRKELLERQRNVSQELYSVYSNIGYLVKDNASEELFNELKLAMNEFGIGVEIENGEPKFYLKEVK